MAERVSHVFISELFASFPGEISGIARDRDGSNPLPTTAVNPEFPPSTRFEEEHHHYFIFLPDANNTIWFDYKPRTHAL